MAFRKRNTGVQRVSEPPLENASGVSSTASVENVVAAGVRPSPLTGQATTSTGTLSLDSLLGGHAGLALGSSLLIEESGTTDFTGALLKYYAAEGLIHGHTIHFVGVGEQWVKELPALVGASDASDANTQRKVKVDEEKMKIAWRYERLGQVDSERASRVIPNRAPQSVSADGANHIVEAAFCHTFDLAKRMTIPQDASIRHISINPNHSPSASPFDVVLQSLTQSLMSLSSSTVHRVVMPTILSPAIYPPNAAAPQHLIRFLHSLRSLLRQYSSRLTVMMTLPLELYHRTSGLVRWAETLSDGVVELTPFPHMMDFSNSLAESGGARGLDEQPQGMLKIHKLPITTDRGGGCIGSGLGDDLAFTVSRRKFVIKPFSLPPVEGDTEAQRGEAEGGALGKATKVDIEF